MSIKICSKCKQEKTEDLYSSYQFKKKSGQCKECKAKYTLSRKKTTKISDVMSKICSICRLEKDIINFGRDTYTIDGYNQRCKECQIKNNKKYRQRTKNKNLQNIKEEYINKICANCKIEKNISQFGKDIYSIDCLQRCCKACNTERNKKNRKRYKEININKEINIKTKVCSKCKIEKDIFQFNKCDETSNGFTSHCKLCISQYHKIYNENIKQININKTHIEIKNKICSKCKIEKDVSKFSIHSYTIDGLFTYCKECYSQYQKENKSTTNKRKNDRRKTDPKFKLRSVFSKRIYNALKSRKLTKGGLSTWKMLPYSLQQLLDHIDSLFDPWMNWGNHGKYEPNKWDDNDPTTWKWQLDHIIPESEFNYTSFMDQEFRKCWALSNLRPYSAKLNIIDGSTRIRHKKKTAK